MLHHLLTALAIAGVSPVTSQTVLLRKASEPALCVHHLSGAGPAVLYVHGATFPSALSIGYKIDGKSWADDLHKRGFDVWSFDFAGYGCSDRAQLESDSDEIPGRAPNAEHQIERVARYIRSRTRRTRISIIAHSWGTIPAGLFAGLRPQWVDRLVLFGPVAERHGKADPAGPDINFVTAKHQWNSFQAGLPSDQGSLISKGEFDAWIKAYLATDRSSSKRTPPSVAVPGGPDADFNDAWSGHLPYDPSRIVAPTLIVRGQWDPIARDSDVAWLLAALNHVPGGARDVKLAEGAHRMLLERNRQELFDAVGRFLSGDKQ